tara:strand:+ start:906 stop:1397 length:492 start_codon:yes stop_codon:yes gene_type:complete
VGIRLNLGCGRDIKQGFTNVDKFKSEGTDVVHDLDRFPYPFKRDSVDYILMKSSLEHLKDIPRVMEEIYKICKDNAIIEIIVPHFESFGAFKDTTHFHFFTYFSFDYDFYLDKFRIIKRKFIYPRFCFLFEWLANSWPRFHEIILRKFLPVKDIYFKLQVKKQ